MFIDCITNTLRQIFRCYCESKSEEINDYRVINDSLPFMVDEDGKNIKDIKNIKRTKHESKRLNHITQKEKGKLKPKNTIMTAKYDDAKIDKYEFNNEKECDTIKKNGLRLKNKNKI